MGQRLTTINVSAEAARRLKIHAANQDRNVYDLGTEILLEWLDQQPLVGGPSSRPKCIAQV